MVDFSVQNETTTNIGIDFIGYGRMAQTSQWKTVLNNVKIILGSSVKSETVHKEISIQNPQKGDAIKVVHENLLNNNSSETYIEKQ